MFGLPIDVWAMMGFSILVFFGGTLWALFHTLREEDRKLRLLRSESSIDSLSPHALRDLRAWIEAHPDDPEIERGRALFRECVDTLRTAERHFYDWSDPEIDRLDTL